MNREGIVAHLNLYAVLPRLEDLVRLDEEARRIAADMNIAIRFRVQDGPSLTLAIRKGTVTAKRGCDGWADVGLYFYSCNVFNRMFAGEKVVPIPYKGFTKLGQMKQFTRLSEILTKYLKPSDADMKNPSFRDKAVELTLMVGLASVREIADHDEKMKRVAGHLKDGTVLFKVNNGPQAHVLIERGIVRAVNGPVPNPTTTVEIKDIATAAALLGGKLDAFAALGNCDIRMTGLLPLADDVNALLDRVGLYLA